jgi:chemotaxis protein MotC
VTGPGKLAGAAIICGLVLAWPAQGQNSGGEPYELVRSLQSLQDQIARGNARAHAHQRVLIGRIAEQFDAADPERWKDPKNARAAVLFVLNGGNVRALQKVIGSGSNVELDEKLLNGVLAYGEGRQETASQMLASIDARSLHPSLAGHVAYVQGELTEKKQPAQALTHFDDARLLAPGTIVEEAALRRQVALLATTGDVDRFEMLATSYLRRFPNSVYSAGFRQKFALALAANTNAADQERLARLTSMLGGVGTAERGEVYLTIAREALVKGKIELARLAASNAVVLAREDTDEKERARFYEAAALIVTDDFDRGIEVVSSIERGKLGEPERVLLDAVLSIAGQIRRLPAEPEADSAPPGDNVKDKDSDRVLGRVRRALAQVDQMLSEPGK